MDPAEFGEALLRDPGEITCAGNVVTEFDDEGIHSHPSSAGLAQDAIGANFKFKGLSVT
jgi:hypothetical protein